MQNKYLVVIAVLGAICGMNLGMVASHVQAYDPGRGDCGQRGFSWEYCGYTQHQPTMTQVGEWCKHYDWTDVTVCGHFNGFGYVQHQPTVNQVSFFRDNCFWSYPVQCNSNLGLQVPSQEL